MKTLLRIIVILLLAAIVAGGWYLVANNTSLASGPDNEGGRPSMTDTNGQSFQPMDRPEGGGEHGASLSQGLAGVAGTLVKLTVITIVVLLIQKGFSLLGNRRSPVSQPWVLSQLRERQAGSVPGEADLGVACPGGLRRIHKDFEPRSHEDTERNNLRTPCLSVSVVSWNRKESKRPSHKGRSF